ncbi:MAG: hypothetical protein ABR552_09550 [Actinomycetota bacterium]|nr:hypothetical protein [Actinomycetota bacterium]
MLKRSFVAIALVALAACGSGASPKSAPSTSNSPVAEPGASFGAATISGLGTVLVDGRGRTVYILTSGGHTNVPCTDASGCTKAWPDVSLPDGVTKPSATGGAHAELISTKRVGSEMYPAYNGWLLYEFSHDTANGQANGEGIKSFGGTWYVLGLDGKPITSPNGGY